MPDTPDQTKARSKVLADEKPDSRDEPDDAGSNEHSYYYDDAHGYKDFDPDGNDLADEYDED
jgi:hypothetical protein